MRYLSFVRKKTILMLLQILLINSWTVLTEHKYIIYNHSANILYITTPAARVRVRSPGLAPGGTSAALLLKKKSRKEENRKGNMNKRNRGEGLEQRERCL